MSGKVKLAVTGLGASMAMFVAMIASEGWSERAIVPVANDKLTIGFGTTVYPDGSPVKRSDTITPQRAVAVAAAHVTKDEAAFKASLPGALLTQGEYDLYLDFSYQYGQGNWRSSSMRRHILAGDHSAACNALLAWRFQAGRDCAKPENWGPRGCKGVWTRQQERHAKCLAEQ